MKCNNCGKDNDNGAMFCVVCGTYLEATENNAAQQNDANNQNSVNGQQKENAYPPYTDGVSVGNTNEYGGMNQTSDGTEPKTDSNKNKKKKRTIIISAIAGVLVIAIVLDFLLFGNIKNFFINIGPADSHLSYVYTNVAEEIGTGVADTYGAVLFDEDGMEASGNIKVEISEEMLAVLGADASLPNITSGDIDFNFARDPENVDDGGEHNDKNKGFHAPQYDSRGYSRHQYNDGGEKGQEQERRDAFCQKNGDNE